MNIEFILPAIIGFLSGIFAPMIVEKWKGKKEEERKVSLIEADLKQLKEEVEEISSQHKEAYSSLEERLRSLELTLSHNTGVLKSKMPEAPLEDPAMTS